MSNIPRVLGHRILVIPDEPETVTASGLLLPEDRDHVAVSGLVVAIGPNGSEVGFNARQEALRDAIAIIEDLQGALEDSVWVIDLELARVGIDNLRGTAAACDVAIGDRVTFPQEVGQQLTVDGDTYIVLNMDDVCVIVPDEVVA